MVYYPSVLRSWLGWTGIFLVMWGVVSIIKLRSRISGWILIGSVVFVYLVFTLVIENKDARYVFPLTFMLLALVGFSLEDIWLDLKKRRLRWLLMVLVIVFLLESVLVWRGGAALKFVNAKEVLVGEVLQSQNQKELSSLYEKIVDDFEGQSEWKLMLVATDFAYVNPFTLAFYAALQYGNPDRYRSFDTFYGVDTIEETERVLERYDAVLVSGGLVAETGSRHASLIKNIQYAVLSRPESFSPVKEYGLSNGQVVWLYKQVRK